jgi:hypothetical protein
MVINHLIRKLHAAAAITAFYLNNWVASAGHTSIICGRNASTACPCGTRCVLTLPGGHRGLSVVIGDSASGDRPCALSFKRRGVGYWLGRTLG